MKPNMRPPPQRFFQLSEVLLIPVNKFLLHDFKYLMLLLKELKTFPRWNPWVESMKHAMCCFQLRWKNHEDDKQKDILSWLSLCGSAHQLSTHAPRSLFQGRPISLPRPRALSEPIFLVIHNSSWEFIYVYQYQQIWKSFLWTVTTAKGSLYWHPLCTKRELVLYTEERTHTSQFPIKSKSEKHLSRRKEPWQ